MYSYMWDWLYVTQTKGYHRTALWIRQLKLHRLFNVTKKIYSITVWTRKLWIYEVDFYTKILTLVKWTQNIEIAQCKQTHFTSKVISNSNKYIFFVKTRNTLQYCFNVVFQFHSLLVLIVWKFPFFMKRNKNYKWQNPRPNLKNLLVSLKIVFNLSRFEPAPNNWNRFLGDLRRGLNSLNSETVVVFLMKRDGYCLLVSTVLNLLLILRSK